MLKSLNAALMFFLELSMLAGFTAYGFARAKHLGARWVLGLSLPLVVVALWSYFAAPRSVHRLAPVPRFAFRLALFELAALAVQRAGSVKLGLCFALVGLLNQALALLWKQ